MPKGTKKTTTKKRTTLKNLTTKPKSIAKRDTKRLKGGLGKVNAVTVGGVPVKQL